MSTTIAPYEVMIVRDQQIVVRSRFHSQTRGLAWIIAGLDEHDGDCHGIVNEWRHEQTIDDYVLVRTAHVNRYQNQLNWKKVRK